MVDRSKHCAVFLLGGPCHGQELWTIPWPVLSVAFEVGSGPTAVMRHAPYALYALKIRQIPVSASHVDLGSSDDDCIVIGVPAKETITGVLRDLGITGIGEARAAQNTGGEIPSP